MGYKVDKSCLEDKRYDNYLEFSNDNKDVSIVEMGTVKDRRGGKALLTIHFIDTSFNTGRYLCGYVSCKFLYKKAECLISI